MKIETQKKETLDVIVDLDGGRIKREVCMDTVWKLLTIHRKNRL